ncbi:hypothetical protein H8356DRAFT_1352008 [Neocallimastix lanati (nom. inval.)]|nr:hypothetical protein H8356DRAFT_1352008 [Neocallimastix sp. JGI-2020a]
MHNIAITQYCIHYCIHLNVNLQSKIYHKDPQQSINSNAPYIVSLYRLPYQLHTNHNSSYNANEIYGNLNLLILISLGSRESLVRYPVLGKNTYKDSGNFHLPRAFFPINKVRCSLTMRTLILCYERISVVILPSMMIQKITEKAHVYRKYINKFDIITNPEFMTHNRLGVSSDSSKRYLAKKSRSPDTILYERKIN